MNAKVSQETIDERLELEIDAACERMVTGTTEEIKRTAWTEMAVLLRRRSDTQVMRMELEYRLIRGNKKT